MDEGLSGLFKDEGEIIKNKITETESNKYWRDKYDELVKGQEDDIGKDEEIIAEAKNNEFSFQDGTAGLITEQVEKILFNFNPEYQPDWLKEISREDFIKLFSGKRLLDVGCGEYGVVTASKWLNSYKDLNIKQVVLVDPYIKRFLGNVFLWKDTESTEHEEYTATEWLKMAKDEKIVDYCALDGLSFLLDQPDFSGNVVFSSINHSLIPDERYHLRLAQEALRVVPVGGCLLTCNSKIISSYAKEFFPKQLNLTAVEMFMKE